MYKYDINVQELYEDVNSIGKKIKIKYTMNI